MIFEKLKELLLTFMGDSIDISKLTLESTLKDDICVNSITMLMMGIAIEEEFNLRLTSEDMSKCLTIGDIVYVISEKLK